MPVTYPIGNAPYVFTDTLPAGSTAISAAPIGAQQIAAFTTMAPQGQMFLTFVVFAYPQPRNGSAAAPAAPLVEILPRKLSGKNDVWQTLQSTKESGIRSIELPPVAGEPGFVDYSYLPLAANGVFQIMFQQNGDTPFNDADWAIRFTVNDGVTTPVSQSGLTFVLDAVDVQAPWLAVPGQLHLPPSLLDFGSLPTLTLAGVAPLVVVHVAEGTRHDFAVPIGNYGTAPLRIRGTTNQPEDDGVFLEVPVPFTIAPGHTDIATFRAIFVSPRDVGVRRQGGPVALYCDDPFAAPTGATAHFSTVSVQATSAGYPF